MKAYLFISIFVSLLVGVASAASVDQEDAKRFATLPVIESGEPYIEMFTDEQGRWDIRKVDPEVILKVYRAKQAMKTEKYRKLAGDLLERYLRYDIETVQGGEFQGQVPSLEVTRKRFAEINDKLKPYGLSLHHSPFLLSLFYQCGQKGSQSFGSPKTGGQYKNDFYGKPKDVCGSIDVSPEPLPAQGESPLRLVADGTALTLKATPAAGFRFERWTTLEGQSPDYKTVTVGTLPTLRITVKENEPSVTAVFQPRK